MVETYSQMCYVCAGVSQGSVFCPVFYVLYTEDLNELEKITTCTYADDA